MRSGLSTFLVLIGNNLAYFISKLFHEMRLAILIECRLDSCEAPLANWIQGTNVVNYQSVCTWFPLVLVDFFINLQRKRFGFIKPLHVFYHKMGLKSVKTDVSPLIIGYYFFHSYKCPVSWSKVTECYLSIIAQLQTRKKVSFWKKTILLDMFPGLLWPLSQLFLFPDHRL